jgi:hypothetical protein
MKELFINLINEMFNLFKSQRVVPIVSGATSILLLRSIIFSDKLQEVFAYVSMGICLAIFIISVSSYTYLSKIEKDKDTEMLEMTKRIVEAVYKHFGVAIANKDCISAEKIMNPIMDSIVKLIKEFQKLAEKGYKN